MYLVGGVRNVIEQIFDALEADFGRALVRAVIFFITFSANGISDLEMLDLLSLDAEVMSAKKDGMNQRNKTSRCPTRELAFSTDCIVMLVSQCLIPSPVNCSRLFVVVVAVVRCLVSDQS